MPIPSHSSIPINPSDYACVDLVNSSFSDYLGAGETVDRLASPEWQEWFVDWHDAVPEVPGAAPLDELVRLRRDIHRVLDKWSKQVTLSARDLRLLDGYVRDVPLRHRVAQTSDGLELRQEPLRRDWSWVLATIAESAVELMAAGDPRRLKTCANPDCSWMFYDNTVNRSRRFCSTTPCGSLIRVRRFREHG